MEKRKFESEHSAPDGNVCFEQEAGGQRGRDVDFLEGRSQGSRKGSGGGGDSCCKVENCGADLRNAKQYHRRHRVCEDHSKAQVVLVSGIRQRFCQQCSRFHGISEFDESKRSCRKGLAGHNERRRKQPMEPTAGEAASSRRVACRQVNIQENATYNKHFQINKATPAPSLLS